MAADADVLTEVRAAAEAVARRSGLAPEDRPAVGIVLGTGLGGLADELVVTASLEYAELPGFSDTTVSSHQGRLLLGRLDGVAVAVLQGRLHHYEGIPLQRVVFPIRVLAALGVRTLILTSACGGMHPLWAAGDIVVIDDHINLMGGSPLLGPNIDELGPRFPDMSQAYDPELQSLAMAQALKLGMPLQRGVYAAVTGPNLETRAEYRMVRGMGADIVGMSTVPEVIAARHMGLRVLGLSVITDQCLPDALEAIDLETIIQTASEAEPRLRALVRAVVASL